MATNITKSRSIEGKNQRPQITKDFRREGSFFQKPFDLNSSWIQTLVRVGCIFPRRRPSGLVELKVLTFLCRSLYLGYWTRLFYCRWPTWYHIQEQFLTFSSNVFITSFIYDIMEGFIFFDKFRYLKIVVLKFKFPRSVSLMYCLKNFDNLYDFFVLPFQSF